MKTTRLHSCNVLFPGDETRQIWQYSISNGSTTLQAENTGLSSDPLPPRWAAKDWRALWQQKVNIAWLPAGQVFVRVVHLPAAEPTELLAMVELQLEKLSPLPVAQIVWSCEVLPRSAEGLQTVIVLITARNQVEEFLGRLEGQGYLADRLELPLLQQLLSVASGEDGLWLCPSNWNNQHFCLVAWWSGGRLQHLNLMHLPGSKDWGAILIEHLTQIAWAGEIEGWLTAQPRCRLVADASTAAVWEPVLSKWAGEGIELLPGLAPPEMAALGAQRLASGETQANLLPAEYASRYRQQFIDRLWMGGLGAVVAIYLVGVLVFFAALEVLRFQQHRVESKIASLTKPFNDIKQLKARVQVLQEQVDLRYAALECWKAACVRLPAELTLTSLQLQQGRVLMLAGTAPADQVGRILAYNKELKDYHIGGPDGPLLFEHVNPYQTRAGAGGGPNLMAWDFTCELRSAEAE